jgi:hypothetical protein
MEGKLRNQKERINHEKHLLYPVARLDFAVGIHSSFWECAGFQ